jgi:riboflavin synthase alpha subunit
MRMDDIKSGQRINCNGVCGTIIGKRSTRNQRFVLVKMDNGFTLKLKADTLSVELPETGATAQLMHPTKQLASVD